MTDPATPATRRGANTTLAWVLVAILVLAVGGLAVALIRGSDSPAPTAAATTPAEESPEPSPEPTPSPTPDAMPLRPPDDHFPESGVSAIPLSADSLEDGDYFGVLHGIDAGARTVDVDIAIFYFGQAAIDYLAANDPEAENPPPNDYHIVNDVVRIRTIPVSADVRIWDWCYTEGVGFGERTFAGWAAAPMGNPVCADGGGMSRDPAQLYWFDVRNGQVAQVIGQFLP